jgi:hypothetical protein
MDGMKQLILGLEPIIEFTSGDTAVVLKDFERAAFDAFMDSIDPVEQDARLDQLD